MFNIARYLLQGIQKVVCRSQWVGLGDVSVVVLVLVIALDKEAVVNKRQTVLETCLTDSTCIHRCYHRLSRTLVLAFLDEAYLRGRYAVVLYQLALDFRIHVPFPGRYVPMPETYGFSCTMHIYVIYAGL